jgi:hypothetical protein
MEKTTIKKSIRRIALLLTVLLALAGSSDAAFAVNADAAPPACPRVRIAFIDSGISTRHIDESLVEPGRNYVFPEADTRDRIGHGTAAASLVLGSADQGVPGAPCFAPENGQGSFAEDFSGLPEEHLPVPPGAMKAAAAVPLVVIDAYPTGAIKNGGTEALCRAIFDAVDEFGCGIINISLSTSEDSEELRRACAYAEEKGVVIVSAAGNDGEGGPAYYPAAYGSVISVGSSSGGAAAGFSGNGAYVLAEGVDLTAASCRNGSAPVTVSGTSYSCAIVTGVCAGIRARYPDMTPAEVREALAQLAEDMYEPGFDARSGWGRVSRNAEVPYPFRDLPAGSQYLEAALSLSGMGIMNGCGGLFMPDAPMTKAMTVCALHRLAGSPEPAGYAKRVEDSEADRPAEEAKSADAGHSVEAALPDEWYSEAAMWAAEQGITESVGSAPGEAVSAEQLRAALKRMAEILNVSAVIEDGAAEDETCADPAEHEMPEGPADTAEPAVSGKPLTRGEAALMIDAFTRIMEP